MKIDLDALSEAELVNLNHRIVERLRIFQQVRSHKKMLDFSIGDRVVFRPDGRTIFGILTRYNRKTVTVVTDAGERWNVVPGLLQRIDKSGGAKTSENVISLRPK